MKRIKTAVVGILLAAGLVLPAAANNISVTNVALVNQDSARTVDVQFDLRWDNSWRVADTVRTNWDAAWVFVKFWGTNGWQHATLATASAAHHPAANSTIDAVADGKGAWVYRSGPYTGAVDYVGTRLQWNYGADGYSFAAGASVTVSVHAIEMVYVPQGAFWAGNTNGIISSSFHALGNDNTPVYIADTNAFTIYWGSGGGNSAVVSNSFPNGYKAFYCMKYEMTQGQYVEFLNKLTRAQQNTRTASQAANNFAMSGGATIAYRNGIRCPGVIPGAPTNIVFGLDADSDGVRNGPNDARDRACNYLSWGDGVAYADWAGLRPMTELEFEKACRGPLPPVASEGAWGDATPVALTGESGTPGSGTDIADRRVAQIISF